MFLAFKECLASYRSRPSFRDDTLAGITVGVIALPLSMALAIATGVPPQHGLYTAIVAGIVTALSGGSRVNISGPTAAFVVILVPIVREFGLAGLLLSGCLAGLMLVVMGLLRFGSLIELVPYPVTIGFTSGIAVVIATLQLRDFLGLNCPPLLGHYHENVMSLIRSANTLNPQALLIGIITLVTLILWPKTRSKIPGHLVALLVGTGLSMILTRVWDGFAVETIRTRFHFSLAGMTGDGIPPILPQWTLPWQLPGPDGKPLGLGFGLLRSLVGPAFAIAILGALESLLCATIADGSTGTKHNPNDELIGQGIGNIVTPFFGGIPATAALARTAASIRAGALTPVASIIHALFVLLSILILAPILSYIPMAVMAALLIMVAWNMSEAKHFVRFLQKAPVSDSGTMLVCFGLTILVDMEVAIGVGMTLAAFLFIRRIVDETHVLDVSRDAHPHTQSLPDTVALYDINGALFFGAAQKAFSDLARLHPSIQVVILDMADVIMIDSTATVAMESIIQLAEKKHVFLIVSHLNPRIILKLRTSGVRKRIGLIEFARNTEEAAAMATRHLKAHSIHSR
jgi:SulP family sulfate permease